jgi:hypothetical protein
MARFVAVSIEERPAIALELLGPFQSSKQGGVVRDLAEQVEGVGFGLAGAGGERF